MILRFDSAPAYELASAILGEGIDSFPYHRDLDERSIEIDDPILAQLLSSLEGAPVVAVPVFGNDSDEWLLAGVDRHSTELAYFSFHRFVLPTFALLSEGQYFARFEPFSSSGPQVHVAAGQLYAGYVALRSPRGQRSIVMRKLAQWGRLLARKPSLALARAPSYAELLSRFHEALALNDPVGAAQALEGLQRGQLITAENSVFLRVRIWAQQGEWRSIYNSESYPRLATLPLPRAIRRALITAFHHEVLLDLEQRGAYEEALTRFKSDRGKLGAMLGGRKPLTDSAVVRVFAYEAAAAQDRGSFDELVPIPGLDAPAQACLNALQPILPPRYVMPIVPAPKRLHSALNDGNYDAAWQIANELESPMERCRNLLRIAMRYPDAGAAAIEAYDSLTTQARAELEVLEPLLDVYLTRLLGVSPGSNEIRDWPGWFDRLFGAPNDTELAASIETLIGSTDTLRQESVTALGDCVGKLFNAHSELLSRLDTKRALESIENSLLEEPEFPQSGPEYGTLYQALFDCLIWIAAGGKKQTEKLLRLAGAVLDESPRKFDAVLSDLRQWFTRPTPALEDEVLDAFDLLIAYGARREHLMELYRDWLGHFLDRPASSKWERAQQEVWLSLGEWLQPGNDLLTPLRERLADLVRAEIDPVAALPQGFRLGIFTLDPRSAERASEILQKRNTSLDIRVCAEKDMNNTVASLARNSDAAVVVTRCLKHAIFYGIGPLLGSKPIYPDSRGSASIVRAVEEFARTRL